MADPNCPYCGYQSSEPTLPSHVRVCEKNPNNIILNIVKEKVMNKLAENMEKVKEKNAIKEPIAKKKRARKK